MLITQTESNPHLGKMLIGKLMSGVISVGDRLHSVDNSGKTVEYAKIMKMIKKYGTAHVQIEKAYPGDIFSLAGFLNTTVGHTVNTLGKFHVIPVNYIKQFL